ncbi:MAG: hypothetical protein EWV40_15740 [Microcystis flos-aquae Mf_WU_F_19750830_S460]|uniref:Uncharacterized protein n=1 Tax=Microcystis flos-aquae Mf_WU_F_19750830_S460 TaxID=2486237 RepID=A0A552LGN1_9CHRO|nr:MAG: hypothetical protein EWV40_15740 [Microcystis flos-aquae Mf_WU_F_19750830_S460]
MLVGLGVRRQETGDRRQLFSPHFPTPHTLHPTPHTLHPTPHTPHPTPYTHLPGTLNSLPAPLGYLKPKFSPQS